VPASRLLAGETVGYAGVEGGLMPSIQTVTGEIPVGKDVGQVLMHEHIVVGWIGSQWDEAAQPDWDAELERVSIDFQRLRQEHGVTLVVDAGPADLGRDVNFQARLSRATGVGIVASTGWYKEWPGLPYYFTTLDDEEIDDFLRRELVDGVGTKGIKCGIIKLGSGGADLSELERKAFRSGARVARDLDVPIITHTDPEGWTEANVGLRQLEALLEGGARADRIGIGHVCGTANLEWLIEICKRGAFVAFDRVGLLHRRADEVRAALIMGLVAAGFVEQILVSHDHQAVWRRRPPSAAAPGLKGSFDHIHRDFLPMLRRMGLSERHVEMLMRDNPLRLLAG
jgi:phosphotriesterase-related protein